MKPDKPCSIVITLELDVADLDAAENVMGVVDRVLDAGVLQDAVDERFQDAVDEHGRGMHHADFYEVTSAIATWGNPLNGKPPLASHFREPSFPSSTWRQCDHCGGVVEYRQIAIDDAENYHDLPHCAGFRAEQKAMADG